MNKCRNIVRRIHESEGALDRESAEHCLECPECRRELLAALAAADPAAPAAPEALRRNMLARCRGGRALKRRRVFRQALTWSGAAAAVLFTVFLIAAEFTEPRTETPLAAANPEWDGSALLGRISDIGTELGKVEKILSGESERIGI